MNIDKKIKLLRSKIDNNEKEINRLNTLKNYDGAILDLLNLCKYCLNEKKKNCLDPLSKYISYINFNFSTLPEVSEQSNFIAYDNIINIQLFFESWDDLETNINLDVLSEMIKNYGILLSSESFIGKSINTPNTEVSKKILSIIYPKLSLVEESKFSRTRLKSKNT